MWSFELLHRFMGDVYFPLRSFAHTFTQTLNEWLPSTASKRRPNNYNHFHWHRHFFTWELETVHSCAILLRRKGKKKKTLSEIPSPALVPPASCSQSNNNNTYNVATTPIAVTAAAVQTTTFDFIARNGRYVDKVKWISYLCSANSLLIFGENFFAGTSFRIINFTVSVLLLYIFFPLLATGPFSHFTPTQLSAVFNKLSVQRCLECRIYLPIQPVKIFTCRIDWAEETRQQFQPFHWLRFFFFFTPIFSSFLLRMKNWCLNDRNMR